MISDQKINDRMPSTLLGRHRQGVAGALERLPHGVQRARADVAVDHAERGERQPGQGDVRAVGRAHRGEARAARSGRDRTAGCCGCAPDRRRQISGRTSTALPSTRFFSTSRTRRGGTADRQGQRCSASASCFSPCGWWSTIWHHRPDSTRSAVPHSQMAVRSYPSSLPASRRARMQIVLARRVAHEHAEVVFGLRHDAFGVDEPERAVAGLQRVQLVQVAVAEDRRARHRGRSLAARRTRSRPRGHVRSTPCCSEPTVASGARSSTEPAPSPRWRSTPGSTGRHICSTASRTVRGALGAARRGRTSTVPGARGAVRGDPGRHRAGVRTRGRRRV